MNIELTADYDPASSMKQRQRIIRLVSDGGVVFRANSNGGFDVVICGKRVPEIWGLPKGTPDPGESREETALREVREETGLDVRIDDFIDSIEYWFVSPQEGARCQKTVHFYLMSATGGDISLHDHEFDFVEWAPVEVAFGKLTYENEVKIVQKGLSMVAKKTCRG